MSERSVAVTLKRAAELQTVSDSARLDTELLLSHVLDKNRTWLFTWPEKQLSESQMQAFDRLFRRRLNGEPIAHILGEKEFWSLPFYVDASTLIPRPDTERLVECTLERAGGNSALLDLGTGTGAIALALASEMPCATIIAVDKSEKAVALATRNRDRLQLSNVTLRVSDWFEALKGERFDFIVSNPPYIDANDPHLNEGDVAFEPASALVAQDQGIADIHTIIAEAPLYLGDNGLLLLEHGWQQAALVRDLFKRYGFREVQTFNDIGGNERVTLAKKPLDACASNRSE
ncbi:peptide chain release factor N(5)-glutamine methyltransferase [Teredinibacter purpureus]|uniref:peptide chain release factor N(5)-glutamine methyltransferase n=1 Tax=Teredinibacter purpureus TaxID=2731756 RepID=UPI0005F76E78|nr:peptide chain release factor N(5)-glutamine methyltransferase [Teredinibacter purpureus]